MRLRFAQPFDRIAIEAEASGFDFASREIDARDIGFHLTTEPMAGLFRLDRLSLASPEGGRLEATAALERLQLEAKLDFKRFAARQVLPPALRPAARAMVDGVFQVRAESDVRRRRAGAQHAGRVARRGAARTRWRCSRGRRRARPPGATVVRLAGVKARDGVLRLPRVDLAMWGGSFAAEGRIAVYDPDDRRWLAAPRLDLTLQAKGIQIDRLIGSRFAGGALTFRAHVRGNTEDVALDVEFSEASALTVLGERVRLPARATLRVADSTIMLADFPLGGPGEQRAHLRRQDRAVGAAGARRRRTPVPDRAAPGHLGTTLPRRRLRSRARCASSGSRACRRCRAR